MQELRLKMGAGLIRARGEWGWWVFVGHYGTRQIFKGRTLCCMVDELINWYKSVNTSCVNKLHGGGAFFDSYNIINQIMKLVRKYKRTDVV